MNHVFTCAGCGRQWSIHSTDKLECFFVGLCYWCIRKSGLLFAVIAKVLQLLMAGAIAARKAATAGAEKVKSL